MAEAQVNFGRKYSFSSGVLDIIISGGSAIDSTEGFNIPTLDDAERFLRSYGFNLENPIEKAEAFGNFHEALAFIRRYFLKGENPAGLDIEVPRKILELSDVRELFLLAGLNAPGQGDDKQGHFLRNWACSVLKVMHTIAHVDQDLRTPYFAEIQKQILDRYYRLIHRDEEQMLFLGDKSEDSTRVSLVSFETKPKKSRDSTLLKLLHKPENVAEDIFDRVGIRFITHTRTDAIRVVKLLKEKLVIMPPNIKPSRSRNTLVNVDAFRATLAEYLPQVERGSISEVELLDRLEVACKAAPGDLEGPGGEGRNIHSSQSYAAIQFTSRQLIKLRSPLYQDLKELKSRAKDTPLPEEVHKIIERVDLKYTPKEIRFFYPYEIQVMDRASAEENERGRSAHSEYKASQLQTALKRVMGSLGGG